MADLAITLGDLEQKADELRGNGATALFLAVDGKPGSVIAIADPIKSTTPAAPDRLREDGIRIVMLTGDNKTTAEAVARKLGIEESKPTFCLRTRTGLSRNSPPKDALSPWPATG
jgi:Cu+-exporting ATPase